MKKKIVILGASGSVGQQTLNVISQRNSDFECIGLSIHSKWEKVKSVLDEASSLFVCVNSEELADELQKKYPQHKLFHGDKGLKELAENDDADLVVNAIVGYAGLEATIAALKSSKTVALANKESLVVAGNLLKKIIKRYGGSIVPIDSEHSGIYQCTYNSVSKIQRVIITASGGSLRDYSRNDYPNITIKQALAHPNWEMGAKITIDSASMANKAFEVIGAHHLFDLEYNQIDVMMHKQSKVHALVEFEDHSFIAQLGSPDMRVVIAFALSEGYHLPLDGETLDFTRPFSLDFTPLDIDRYPVYEIIINAAKQENSLITSLNSANEELIELFLLNKINFYQLENTLIEVANTLEVFDIVDIDDIKRADQLGREAVKLALGGNV